MHQASIERHPDLLDLRASYERAAHSVTAQVTFGLTLLAGVYAAASPWIIGFASNAGLAVSDLIVGLAVSLLAIGLGSALDRSHGLAWTVPLLGAWLIAAPWAVNDTVVSAGAAWSNLVVGASITLLGLGAAYFGMQARDRASH